MRQRSLAAPLLAVLAALAVVACGTTGASSAPPSAAPPSVEASPTEAMTEEPTADESSPAESSPAESMAPGDTTVAVADSSHGQILVDGAGLTLYGFTPDEETGESTCYDDCAAAWPPLLEDDEVTVGEGLDDSDFSLVPRTDGSMQVAINGWPLYYFAGDSAPGDTNGQGLQEIWYVVSPSGELIGR